MHGAALGVRDLFGLLVALALLGCVLALPTTGAGVASSPEPTVAVEDGELVRLAERAKAAFPPLLSPPPRSNATLTHAGAAR